MFYIFYIIAIIPILILLPVIITGKRNVPRKGRVIITCNHQSNCDGVMIAAHSRRRLKIMAKEELFKNKLFGWVLKVLGCYPVKRGGNDIASVKQTLKYLKEERALLIFPEGTRLKDSDTSDIKNGAALFALKTKSPIVPAMFVKPTKLFRINRLIYGQSYNLSEMDEFKDQPITKELLEKASDVIVAKMREIKTQYLERKKK